MKVKELIGIIIVLLLCGLIGLIPGAINASTISMSNGFCWGIFLGALFIMIVGVNE
jgi:hypothetical protein